MNITKVFGFVRAAVFQKDPYARFLLNEGTRYTLMETLMRIFYPRYKMSDFGRLYLNDEPFIRYYESFYGTQYRHLDRKFALKELMKLVAHVEGDFIECGSLAGGSAYLMCQAAGTKKLVHLFDSFEGLPKGGAKDGTHWQEGDLVSGEDVIRRNLKDFDNVRFYKGWIPERFGEIADRTVCFLHLDVDFYQPTLDALEFFYDKMSPGAIIICDDYGFVTTTGAKEAMDTFFANKPETLVHLPTGQGFVIKQ